MQAQNMITEPTLKNARLYLFMTQALMQNTEISSLPYQLVSIHRTTEDLLLWQSSLIDEVVLCQI